MGATESKSSRTEVPQQKSHVYDFFYMTTLTSEVVLLRCAIASYLLNIPDYRAGWTNIINHLATEHRTGSLNCKVPIDESSAEELLLHPDSRDAFIYSANDRTVRLNTPFLSRFGAKAQAPAAPPRRTPSCLNSVTCNSNVSAGTSTSTSTRNPPNPILPPDTPCQRALTYTPGQWFAVGKPPLTEAAAANIMLDQYIDSLFLSHSLSSDDGAVGNGTNVASSVARSLAKHLSAKPPPHTATEASLLPVLRQMYLSPDLQHLSSPWELVEEVCVRWPEVFELVYSDETYVWRVGVFQAGNLTPYVRLICPTLLRLIATSHASSVSPSPAAVDSKSQGSSATATAAGKASRKNPSCEVTSSPSPVESAASVAQPTRQVPSPVTQPPAAAPSNAAPASTLRTSESYAALHSSASVPQTFPSQPTLVHAPFGAQPAFVHPPPEPSLPGLSDSKQTLPAKNPLEKHIMSRFRSPYLPSSSDASGSAGRGSQYSAVYSNLARCLMSYLVSEPPPYLATKSSLYPMLMKLRLQTSIPHQLPWDAVIEVCARWPEVFKLDVMDETDERGGARRAKDPTPYVRLICPIILRLVTAAQKPPPPPPPVVAARKPLPPPPVAATRNPPPPPPPAARGPTSPGGTAGVTKVDGECASAAGMLPQHTAVREVAPSPAAPSADNPALVAQSPKGSPPYAQPATAQPLPAQQQPPARSLKDPCETGQPLLGKSPLEKHIMSHFNSSSHLPKSNASKTSSERAYDAVYSNLARCLARHLVSEPQHYLATKSSLYPMLVKLRLQTSLPHLQIPWDAVVEVCVRWPEVFKLDVMDETAQEGGARGSKYKVPCVRLICPTLLRLIATSHTPPVSPSPAAVDSKSQGSIAAASLAQPTQQVPSPVTQPPAAAPSNAAPASTLASMLLKKAIKQRFLMPLQTAGVEQSIGGGKAGAMVALQRCVTALLLEAPPPHVMTIQELGVLAMTKLGCRRLEVKVRAVLVAAPDVFAVEQRHHSVQISGAVVRLICPTLIRLAGDAAVTDMRPTPPSGMTQGPPPQQLGGDPGGMLPAAATVLMGLPIQSAAPLSSSEPPYVKPPLQQPATSKQQPSHAHAGPAAGPSANTASSVSSSQFPSPFPATSTSGMKPRAKMPASGASTSDPPVGSTREQPKSVGRQRPKGPLPTMQPTVAARPSGSQAKMQASTSSNGGEMNVPDVAEDASFAASSTSKPTATAVAAEVETPLLPHAAVQIVTDPYSPECVQMLSHVSTRRHLGLAVHTSNGKPCVLALYAPALEDVDANEAPSPASRRPVDGQRTVPRPDVTLKRLAELWPATVYLVDCTSSAVSYGGVTCGEVDMRALLDSLRSILESPNITKVVNGYEQVRMLELACGGAITTSLHDVAPLLRAIVAMLQPLPPLPALLPPASTRTTLPPAATSTTSTSTSSTSHASSNTAVTGTPNALAGSHHGPAAAATTERQCSSGSGRGSRAPIAPTAGDDPQQASTAFDLAASMSQMQTHVKALHHALEEVGLWADQPHLLEALLSSYQTGLFGKALRAGERDASWEQRPLSGAQLAVAASSARHLPELWEMVLGEAMPWVAAQCATRSMQLLRGE